MYRVLAAKDPGARAAYQFDWTTALAAWGDLLDSADVFVADDSGQEIVSDLTIDGVQCTAAGVVSFFASGGTPGAQYRVRCKITGVNTVPVQTVDFRSFILPVSEQ